MAGPGIRYFELGRRLAEAHDPGLRTLIDVVGFGVPESPPEPTRAPVLRGGVFPEDARIMVWNGGLWDWLDPLTVLRALALLRERDGRWRLAFLGTAPPGGGAGMAMGRRAAELAAELGIGDVVHFHDGWTPYAERAAPLLECDLG